MFKKLLKEAITINLIVSLLVGGLAGFSAGLVGYSLTGNYLEPWLNEHHISVPGLESKTDNFNNQINTNGSTVQTVVADEVVLAVKKVKPAVVSVVITKDYGQGGMQIVPFGGIVELPQGKQQTGAGTGFIISSDGLILTNKHVVADDSAEYSVITNDGQEYAAKILATDPFNDMGILKIEAHDLPVVTLGDSDKLEIGQTVIAIGNSLGEYSNTVTRGIISAIGRRVTAGDNNGSSEVLEEAIQTDAAINPGNSGGPLINLAGEVIGINTAINQSGQSIGFVIPINQAKKVIDSVKQYGRIVRPYLGIRYIPVTADLAKKNNLSVDYGALIIRGQNQGELAIVPGGPADKAGLEENDIILEINGQKIDESHSLVNQIAKYNPGDKLKLKVLHDGQEKTVEVTLEEYKN